MVFVILTHGFICPILEDDLNIEIDRLMQLSAEQKQRIAELECRLMSNELQSEEHLPVVSHTTFTQKNTQMKLFCSRRNSKVCESINRHQRQNLDQNHLCLLHPNQNRPLQKQNHQKRPHQNQKQGRRRKAKNEIYQRRSSCTKVVLVL